MQSQPSMRAKARSRPWTDGLVTSGLFFVPAFLYIWLWIDSRLLYRGFAVVLPETPVFSTGWPFFRRSLAVPAGLVTYLSGYLSQWYYHTWAGALIVILAALLVTVLIAWHFAHAGLPRVPLLIHLPAICVLLIVGQYRHPLSACLTVTLGLLFSLIFEQLPGRRASVRLPVFAVLVAVGYALMGAGGVFLFALMTAIHSIFLRRQWWPALVALVASVVLVRGLGEYVYLLPPRTALLLATPFSADVAASMRPFLRILLVALYILAPAALVVMQMGKLAWSRRRKAGLARKAKGKAETSRSGTLRLVAMALPLVVLVVGLALTHERSRRDSVQINAAARQQQWPQVLDLARALPKGKANVACNHDINRALYHTGRLPYEMFSFPQNPHALLLTHEARPSPLTQLQLCGLFLELGNVNTAEKMASELLATEGHLGVVLEKLAWINIVKEQTETARVYLNVLQKDPIYRDTARAMLAGLAQGFSPERTAWIVRIRSCMPTDPYGVTYGGSVERILAGLLECNPHNRMAFEYLMACHLLTRQLEKVIASLDRCKTFDYDGMPTYFEEALLIWHTMQRRPIDPAALGVSPETYERYKTFLQISRDLKDTSKQQQALNRLVREFGSSYFFYYGFGRVGVATSDGPGGQPLARAR